MRVSNRARLPLLLLAILAVSGAAIAACGSSAPAFSTSPDAASITVAPPSATGSQATTTLQDWLLFDLTPQRYGSTSAPTGITAANVGHLHRLRVSLPGTVDS